MRSSNCGDKGDRILRLGKETALRIRTGKLLRYFRSMWLCTGKRAENKAKACVTLGPVKTLSRQTVAEMIASEMQDAGAQRLCRGTRKLGLDGFFYRKGSRGNEVVECLILKGLKLTFQEILRWRAVSDRVARTNAE